ncbi:M14 family zinc carboxypeptidase [Kineococcus gypseus]|uniref:M14 family metallopeptidase n=1 Tax=Kineococcus gypseus TaxID=1637102 RepID=UPI003D7C8936
MRRRTVTALSALALLVPLLAGAAPAHASPGPLPGGDRLAVHTGVLDAAGLAALSELGVDRRELVLSRAVGAGAGSVRVEAVLSGEQARALAARGVDVAPKTAATRSTLAAPAATVFRPYSGPGGLAEELRRQVEQHPGIAELVPFGRSVQGQEILAVRVTADAARRRDGSRPATVYVGAQHAREWITPEMVRRLLDRVLDGYGSDPVTTDLVDRNELWFVPVANPDGYDFTFQEGQRLWRKNLRDNDGDGEIAPGDGVDLNRNFPTRWGYDDEGSSPDPGSETYRGPSPASEPETQALDALVGRITPEFFVNYHSAAELLLHGIGWQVATPSPDDVLYEAMVGDDAEPAVPGYDPDLSAELYTTNGDTDAHLQEAYGTLGFTPEMSTCAAAAASVAGDAWEPEACGSGFEFPDDERLVQAEFEKNVPFALAVARSAADPDDPVSVVGRTAEDFRVDTFSVSHGDPQTVAVVAKRALRDVLLRYRIGDGPVRRARVAEWQGGERYGDENDDYYAELRGQVRGARPGDEVEVWFEGRRHDRDGGGRPGWRGGRGERVQSEHFTYTVAADTGRRVLVLADEDQSGANPGPPGQLSAPQHLRTHLDALAARGIEADTWDVDVQGVPHDLGVLGHYDAVLWYLGDNRLTQDAEDELTEAFFLEEPGRDLAVSEQAQQLTIAVRDYLNEGGKLVHAGETSAYHGALGSGLGGIWYGLDGAPEEDCVITSDISDCLLLADDFAQYYLGAYTRTTVTGASGVRLTAGAGEGLSAAFGGPATARNPVDEAGVFTVTSDVLPVEDFPQFASEAAGEHVDPTGPFLPVEGDWAAGSTHRDNGYARLTRTFDLGDLDAADAPALQARFSWDLEAGYDHAIVEARTAGADDWTTLPERGGATGTAVPTECEVGYLLQAHPWLTRYLTAGDPCLPQGTTGAWHSLTGSSGGWREVAFDLSAFAGGSVEVSISHVTDVAVGGTGVVVDDTRLSTADGPREVQGFEDGLGAWSAAPAPEGSPAGAGGFERTGGLGGRTAAVATADTVLLGFGLEQLADAARRADVAGAALEGLLTAPTRVR